MTHERAVCFSLPAASSLRAQGASGFAANEAEMGKFCFSFSVWIPFTELSGSNSNCCRFLYTGLKGELVGIGRQHVTCMHAAQALLVCVSLDIMLCSRQMFATQEDSLLVFLPQMSHIILAKTLSAFCGMQIGFSYLMGKL